MVDSGAAENVMPRTMFPEVPPWKRGGPRMGKDLKDQEDSTSRIRLIYSSGRMRRTS